MVKETQPREMTLRSQDGTTYHVVGRARIFVARALCAASNVSSWSHRTRTIMLLQPFTPDFHVTFTDRTTLFLHVTGSYREAGAVLQRTLDELCPIPAMVLTNDDAYRLKRLFNIGYKAKRGITRTYPR